VREPTPPHGSTEGKWVPVWRPPYWEIGPKDGDFGDSLCSSRNNSLERRAIRKRIFSQRGERLGGRNEQFTEEERVITSY